MKIQSVKIANFRNLEFIEKQINGANIILLGENQKGKSNFIKAIEIALGMTSQIGVDPVAHGKTEAHIQVVTDDKGNEYKFEVKFKEGVDRPTVTVTAPNGLKNTTKTVIGSIVGEIEFDIDKFVEMSRTVSGRKEQVEIVRSFLPEDVKETLRKHENAIKLNYEDRTEINRQIKAMDGFIASSGLEPGDKEKYFLIEPVEPLNAELNTAIDKNKQIDKADAARDLADKSMASNITEAEKIGNQIEELKKKRSELESANVDIMLNIQKIDAWKSDPANKPVELKVVQDKIEAAQKHNVKHAKVNDVRTQEMKRDELAKEAENLTVLIETARQLVSDTIKDLEMPIEGLSFIDDALTYNGSVVDESTLSTSEIMMLGVKLKMAKNPNARVLFIERGESLGTQKLKDLQDMAKKYDFQIIMEQVERGTEELVIEFMPEIEPVKA